MKIADAEQQFIESARLHGLYTRHRQFAATTAEYNKIVAALRVLRALPDRGQDFLLGCVTDPDPSVVTWAALYLLPYRENEAVQALSRVTQSDTGLIGLGAEKTLEEWRAGRLTVE